MKMVCEHYNLFLIKDMFASVKDWRYQCGNCGQLLRLVPVDNIEPLTPAPKREETT